MEGGINIGVLISGGGSNLQAIMDACDDGAVDGRVAFVGSDRPQAAGLERARKRGIPTFVIDYAAIVRSARDNPSRFRLPADFQEQVIRAKMEGPGSHRSGTALSFFLKTRAVAEEQLLRSMGKFSFDLLVLAGFMRTLTPYFIDRVNRSPNDPRIMNIHPALLPAFPGVDGYGDTFRYGCKVGGCTVHFVDYGEDSGPIIGQAVFEIDETDDLDAVREKGLKQEWRLYPRCIQRFAQGRLKTERTEHRMHDGRSVQRTIVRVTPSG